MQRPELEEEGRAILRSIVEKQAWRQLVAMNMLGHCLKYIPEIETKLLLAAELDTNLRLFRELQRLYRELGWTDIEQAVRERIDSVPYPGTRLEYAIGRHLCELAERTAMRAYVDSASANFAAIARSHLDASWPREEVELGGFAEYCQDAANRPHAQQLLARWLAIALRSFGRPGSRGDARAVALGLRDRHNEQMIREYLKELEPLLRRCGLFLPGAETLGLVLPAPAAARH
jgi:1,2-phenylacetyl-CoA epoxidase catalytic subunit